MIVLAIAGLILLIVFLAVPALQRTARNTSRKNDAANIASSISTFESNNNGNLPVGFGGSTPGQIDACAVGGVSDAVVASTACGSGNTESAKVGYYTGSVVYVNNTSTVAAPLQVTASSVVGKESVTTVTSNSVLIVLDEECPNTPGGAESYSSRDAAIYYVTESSSGNNGSLQCVQA
ncbi:unnamed protein product [Sphagnum balticum]